MIHRDTYARVHHGLRRAGQIVETAGTIYTLGRGALMLGRAIAPYLAAAAVAV